MTCPFCTVSPEERILIAGDLCFFMDTGDPVLTGSGMVLPRAHRETVFEMTHGEWAETRSMLQQAKQLLDEAYRPDGYNIGWNCGAVAGQDVMHAHLHVIPRFRDEPRAGQGIRYHLRQPQNRRASK